MKTKFPLPEAERIARGMAGSLSPFCVRVEVAGSIRRKAAEVGDIEIVCIPKYEKDMFGDETNVSRLEGIDWSIYGTVIANGPRMKKIFLRQGIQLDLFIVMPPAQFGYIFLLRTGPADYSHRIVTPRNKRGLLPSHLVCDEGAIWSHGDICPTPEESDVFRLLSLPYVEPWDRK